MKSQHYLSVLMISLTAFVHAQYKRSFNHYYRTPRMYQTILVQQANEANDLVRVEPGAGGDLLISTSTVDKKGELSAVKQFSFSLPPASEFPLISGVFDNGNERIVMLEFAGNSTMRLYILKYNKASGAEIGHFAYAESLKTAFVNSIINGNEIVNYAVKSSGGLYRIAFNTQDVTTFTEEVVDATVSTIGNANNIIIGRDGGKIAMFNGKEVSSFTTGPKQVYERTAANNYSVHALNSNSSGSVNFVHLPNGNLFLSNNGDLFELNSNFGIVNSLLQQSSTGSLQSEFGIANNRLYHFYTQTGQQKVYLVSYDLSLNLINTLIYSNQKLIDLIPTGNGAALLGYMDFENQVHSLYNGDYSNFNPNPVFIDYFKTSPNPAKTQEFHHEEVVDNLFVNLGLGNQFVPYNSEYRAGMKYNDSIPLVYNASNVYAGYSSTDTLGTHGDFYRQDFLPGPYTTSGLYTDLISDYYNRGFFVSVQMIKNHLDSLHAGHPGYIAPHGIRNWPAHGNMALGQAAELAPFVDVNSNGQYEPYLGDYPSIYGDFCFFSITHDNPNVEKSAFIETHSFKYWFDCDTSEAYRNTIFNKTFYFSRVRDFDQFSLGTYSDIDLGNFMDDYAGTNVELGLVYQYNGDLNDENYSGRIGFKDKTPATGFMILKGSKVADDSVDNPVGISLNSSVNGYGFGDGIVDNEFLGLEHAFTFTGTNPAVGQSDPSTVYDLGNYLNGTWRFGDSLKYGGTGFPGAPCVSALSTNYMYTGVSDPLHYATGGTTPGFTWSEFEPCGTGSTSNPSGDRRMIGSTGKQSLYVGDTVVYDFVYVIGNDTTTVTSIEQPLNSLFAKCAVIKADFNHNTGACGISFNPVEEDLAVSENELHDVSLYPNPTNNTFKIDGLLTPNASIAIYDLNGRLLSQQQNINAQTEFSVIDFKGNFFLVSIKDGNNQYIKRIIKN